MPADGAAHGDRNVSEAAQPAIADPRWLALRDAALDAMVQETLAGGGGARTVLGRLAEALCAIDADPAIDPEALLDLGADVGRHVLSKRILEDSLPEAVAILSNDLSAGGIGSLSLEAHFHRTARIAYAPAAELAGARTAAVEPFVAGLLWGALASAFNSHVEVTAPGQHTFDVLLGEGRNVNEERAT